MNTNEQLITTFYKAFRDKDFAMMQDCYADYAVFSDEVFPSLDAERVRAMWEMFCLRGKDLQVDFTNVRADENRGCAEWIATYTFSKTGRKVVNCIKAEFLFEDGKIIHHRDRFNFYRWACQALGPPGILLGWTPFLRSKVRQEAGRSLAHYIKARAAR